MKNPATYLISLLVVFTFIACNGNSKSGDQTDQTTDTTITTTTSTISESVTDSNGIKTETTTKQTETITQHFDYTGEVMMKGDTWIIRVTEKENSATDYYPKNLTAAYQVEGLKVRFNGTLEEIPKNVRMVGRPITLTEIEKVQ